MGRILKAVVMTLLTCLFPVVLAAGIALVLLFLPVWSLVHCLAKVFRPELKRGANPFEAFLAQEKHLDQDQFNVWTYHVIDGHIPTATIQQLARDNVFSLKDTKGQLVYSKLQDIMTHFLGYAFWKAAASFDVNTHVRDYDYEGELALPNPCHESDLKGTMGKLLVLPWRRNIPRWEVLVHHNYRPSFHSKPRTVLVGRFHHSMMDGYSYLDLLEKVFQETFLLPSPVRKTIRVSKMKLFFTQLWSIIKIPSDLAGTLYDGTDTHKLFVAKKFSGREYNACVTMPVKDVTIRKIREKYNVAYGSVVSTIVSGALTRVFNHAGQPCPDSIAASMTLPAPGHPKIAANHYDFRPIPLPLKSKSRIHRLLETEKNLMKAKSRCLLLPFMVLPLQFLPGFLADFVFNVVMTGRNSLLFSVFIAQPSFSLGGYDVIDSAAAVTVTRNRIGGSCLCYGTPSQLRICLFLNKDVVRSKEAVLKFSDFVQEETEALLGNDTSPVEQK